ncbi:MAG TPA: hypothetical protein VK853_06190 [Ilumatobacteraceae bacterium]|nr:hypothetical protein [Ilumatobacteraceae bacterium]
MAGLRTEFDFTLPKGYVGADGVLHRQGTMRLATARDEIEPLRDRTIDGPDDPYLTILVLARVITSLGTLPEVGVGEVEGLFAADLAFLQDLYGIINFGDQADVAALQASVLPDDTPQDTAVASSGDDGVVVDVGEAADAVDDEHPAPSPRRRGRVEEVSSASS